MPRGRTTRSTRAARSSRSARRRIWSPAPPWRWSCRSTVSPRSTSHAHPPRGSRMPPVSRRLHLSLAFLAEREGPEDRRAIAGVGDHRLGALHELAVLLLGRRGVEVVARTGPRDRAADSCYGLRVTERGCARTAAVGLGVGRAGEPGERERGGHGDEPARDVRRSRYDGLPLLRHGVSRQLRTTAWPQSNTRTWSN